MSVRAAGGYKVVESALADQSCILLDGGVATQLPHGHGQEHERLWGIEALASAPEQVLEVHRSYVRTGVDVITTNTWALPALLESEGRLGRESGASIHWMEGARRGLRLAREAVSDLGREEECAVAFSLNGDLDGPDGAESVRLLARTLAQDPPDLILLETLSLLRPSLFALVDSLLELSIPVWLSFRRCRHGMCGVYGQHWGGPEGDAFGRAARRFEDLGVAALLVNCIPPDHVDGCVSYLRDFTDLPLGVYPNLGYYTNAGWCSESEIGGAEYAELALRWRAEGANIIGGCCGTRPEHIAAARAAVSGILPGHERREEHDRELREPSLTPASMSELWLDHRNRSLFPLPFPKLTRDPAVPRAIPGSYMMWRYLFNEGIGAHQRCLDIGSGTGLQTVQLALNGAAHVHAIDVDEAAVANTLDNATHNRVSDRVSVEVSDIFPWLPEERYEVVVANLPQIPVDPLSQLSSHRPTDYWGRGLIDEVIRKLGQALAIEGRAFLNLTSLQSRERTLALLDEVDLRCEVVAWEVMEMPEEYLEHREHLAHIADLSDAYLLRHDSQELLVCYLLDIRHGGTAAPSAPWADTP